MGRRVTVHVRLPFSTVATLVAVLVWTDGGGGGSNAQPEVMSAMKTTTRNASPQPRDCQSNADRRMLL